MSYCFLHAGPCSGWSDLDFSSKQIVPGLAIYSIACWTSTSKSCEPAVLPRSLQTKSRTESPASTLNCNSCSGLVPSLGEGFRLVRSARSGSRDLVVDLQQAMACIALTFRPGSICFELKSRSDQPRTRSPHAESSNSQ